MKYWLDDFEDNKTNNKGKNVICLPYDNKDIYPFFCSRYGNISYEDYMKMGYDEFSMKLNSIPETEPFYKIIKSRAIDLGKIKDKEERKYWRELKKVNAIPDIYKGVDEIYEELKAELGGRNYGNGIK